MAKQASDTDKGRDTVRDQMRFQHVSTQSLDAINRLTVLIYIFIGFIKSYY